MYIYLFIYIFYIYIEFVFGKMCGGLFYLMVIKHILRVRKGLSEFPYGRKSLVFTLLNLVVYITRCSVNTL